MIMAEWFKDNWLPLLIALLGDGGFVGMIVLIVKFNRKPKVEPSVNQSQIAGNQIIGSTVTIQTGTGNSVRLPKSVRVVVTMLACVALPLCLLLGLSTVGLIEGIVHDIRYASSKTDGITLTEARPVEMFELSDYDPMAPITLDGLKLKKDAFEDALGVVSFFKIESSFASRVTELRIVLHDLKSVKVPLIWADALFEEGTLHMFLTNDGFASVKNLQASLKLTKQMSTNDTDKKKNEVVTGSAFPNNNQTIIDAMNSGDIKSFPFQPNVAWFKNELTEENWPTNTSVALELSVVMQGEGLKRTERILGWFYLSDGELVFEPGELGEGDIDSVAYAILDVDKLEQQDFPCELTIPLDDPAAGSVMKRIETLLIPTKSCKIDFFLRYCFDGAEWIESPRFKEEVRVPIYLGQDFNGALISHLFYELGLLSYQYADRKIDELYEHSPQSVLARFESPS